MTSCIVRPFNLERYTVKIKPGESIAKGYRQSMANYSSRAGWILILH